MHEWLRDVLFLGNKNSLKLGWFKCIQLQKLNKKAFAHTMRVGVCLADHQIKLIRKIFRKMKIVFFYWDDVNGRVSW